MYQKRFINDHPAADLNLSRGIVPLGSAARFAGDIQAILRGVPRFAALSPREIELLCLHMRCIGLSRRVQPTAEAAHAPLLLVLTGEMERHSDGRGIGPAETTRYPPGAWLGRLLDSDGWPQAYRARVPTDLGVLDLPRLHALLAANPDIATKLTPMLFEDACPQHVQAIRSTQTNFSDFNRVSPSQR